MVLDVNIGIFTTAVASGREDWSVSCGLASTLRLEQCCGPVAKAGELRGSSVKDLSRLVLSGRGPEVSLGMAAINSALPKTDCEELNAEALLADKAKGKTVAVIGHFPFTERLRSAAGKLLVFELNPSAPGDLPAGKIPELLRQADVVAITALTLLNGTFDSVLANCRKDAFKMLLGPSAPLSRIVFDYGIDVVSGVVVTDIPLLLTHLAEGANFKSLQGKKLVTLQKKP